MQIARLLASHKFVMTAALLVASALAPSTLPAQTQGSGSSTLTRIQAAGKMTIGYYANAKPLTYKDDSGKVDGYAIALCRLIAADVQSKLNLPNMQVEFVPVDASERFSGIKEGRIDLVCGPSEPTLARRAEVSFSIPILNSGISVIINKDAPTAFRQILEEKDVTQRPLWRGSPRLSVLEQKNFAAISGSTAERLLTERREELKLNAVVSSVPDLATGLRQVADGKSDAFFSDRTVLLNLVQNDPSGKDVVVLDRLFDREALSFVVNRDDEDFRLLVDTTLSNLYRSGKIDAVYEQFFGKQDAATHAWFRTIALPE